ncbi:uncharacterized protein L3040_007079 [Drepanopeziza brunnea f. sp. 'multigermtubi']|uniref:Isopenicillin N synthase-like Fe(2+) 2OG dioxygenase domain-containing protein n=1 Tax=Marssonina brunnea f. sp. multigermtubi (strain MB_m1) TaxID=1072389 RepID=K1WJG4_MARBU|nr:uncharacterized protein MBM_08758 [Drepanopeziza brunnea f. sp. 'multigermtubi' MB_m1]EKD12996.1 hypothetical protein MBM_08758 [Drepanopeziza brunnea f. sp. 'multigermtubi' MB_m1]KAJ5038212.1 hypothetical protein L3040_007079 [Drepanopeziza brunnea f. sp. 'multigermtubi']
MDMAATTSESAISFADHDIPVANLSTISLAKLRAQDPAERAHLVQATSQRGIFLLDLRGDAEGERVLAHLPDVFAVEEKYFSQSAEAKAEDIRHDIRASQDLGWKALKGGESFEISRDELVSRDTKTTTTIPCPPKLFRDQWEKISAFSTGCDEACMMLLNSLSADVVVKHHRADQPSDTGLKMVLLPSLASPPDPEGGVHTDGGSITLLFHHDLSIRAFLQDANGWAFAAPTEGCALVNVADSLQRLSSGKFLSPKHGVAQPFGGVKNRYYLSYFLRPETALLEQWSETN